MAVRRAGFVLAGGRSFRMGRDKALLPFGNRTLVEHVAAEVRAAAGSVALIGPPERYAELELPVLPDLRPGAGPLAGIEAALAATLAGWNLVVACDMPSLRADFLAGLLDEAERGGGRCLLPAGPSGRVEPLCAVYHRGCLDAIRAALDRGERAVHRVAEALGGRVLDIGEAAWFENLNTPEEWNERDLSTLHRVSPRK